MDPVTFAELGLNAWLTVAVVIAVFVCLVWERFSPDIILLGAVAVLTLTGVLSPVDALVGFSNTAVLTVGVLFVVAGALRSTGAIRWVASWVLGKPHGVLTAQARLVGISSTVSAFINNTPVVAMLTGAVEDWCRQSKVSPSKLLIPLSYATILGGMCSIIGTSTNLIVMGLMQEQTDLPPLQMFDPAWVGLPVAIIGFIYFATLGRRLLPDRQTALQQAKETREYVLEMLVEKKGRLDGHRIVDAGLRSLTGAFLVELQRDGSVMPAVDSDTHLQAGDRLIFVGEAAGLRDLRQLNGLSHVEDQVFRVGKANGRHFVEVVLSRRSPVAGDTLRNARFRGRYGAAVVAINRRGKRLSGKPGDVVLQSGDTLLLETTPSFMHDYGQSTDFAMVNLVDDVPPVQPRKAVISLVILGAMIIANAVFHVDIFVSALTAGFAVLLTGCMKWRDARRVVDYSVVVAIACAFSLGIALAQTGVAAAVAGALMQFGAGDAFWTLVIVYLMTVLATELITNNAAAVLMFPIGLAAAHQLGVNPMPFIMAVMIAASASFITPIGYQTNMMVYGPGGYRLTDYVRVGLPLSVLVGIVALTVIPLVWGF